MTLRPHGPTLPTMATDFVTVLAPLDDQIQAKRIYKDADGRLTTDPANPQVKLWSGAQLPVSCAEDLFRTLDLCASQPTWILVRGMIAPDSNPERMERTHVRQPPSLLPALHAWILLDLDSWRPDVKPEDFAANPAEYAALARTDLPAGFANAACWWQATGSAGIKPGVRLRLAFWLERPITDAQAATLAASFAVPVDKTLFTPSQPHYTASPVLDGVEDPVQGPRTGRLDGAPAATLDTPGQAPEAALALARATAKIRRAPVGERRSTLNALAFMLSSKFGEVEIPTETLIRDLEAAAGANALPTHETATTLANAIRDGRSKLKVEHTGWRQLLARDKETDALRSTAANVSLFLEHHPDFDQRLAYDARAHRPLWVQLSPWGSQGPVTEADTTRAVEWFQTQAQIDAKPQWVQAGITKSAQRTSFDPVQDYLRQLPEWDGRKRLDNFFARHLGCEDTALTRAQTQAWFIQAYLRAFATLEAPVQADYLIVLSGPQGLRKSTTLRALCPLPRFFRDALPSLDKADAALAVADSWIVELSELTQRKADRDQFKAFLTRHVDKFRKPYGRDEIEAPRRCAFAGSTNEYTFLTDPTGNRRFWVLTCSRRANVTEVLAERDQLWSEAKALAEAGARPYLDEALEAEAAIQQETHREEGAYEEMLRVALSSAGPSHIAGLTLGQSRRILRVSLNQAAELVSAGQSELHKIRDAMRALGWYPGPLRAGENRQRLWMPPASWAYHVVDKTLSPKEC